MRAEDISEWFGTIGWSFGKMIPSECYVLGMALHALYQLTFLIFTGIPSVDTIIITIL